MKKISDGVWPVMLTPFKGKDQIDFNGLEELTEWYISQGVHGLFSACLSSEALEMGDASKLALVKRVVEIADGRIPVVAGVMGVVSRSKRVEMAHEVLEIGAAAAVLTFSDLVHQGASDEEWMREMDRHLNSLKGCPLGVYECPFPYHRMMTPELTDYVSDHPEFLFLKETSGRLPEMVRKRQAGKKFGLKVFSADALTILEAMKGGLNGFSGLQTNLWPALHVKLFACWQDNPLLAKRLQQFFIDYQWVLHRSYPASAKLYLKMAYDLNIETLSFLEDASVGLGDQEWISELVQAVHDFMGQINVHLPIGRCVSNYRMGR
ncbi:dihydrodipicolinate synthase family protein [Tichowtungia aerotolerans]|uniref:Dihydrodipicolinate synthase family protein n=1 Tax=Tichowtungia aerotolerans TaxID=2697043 RepID=A0A6P1MC66_9BACT|nr:dihydrodipicolinate synthase family protein [Tichowtungia aerotolerans]QHI70154.1 hypothetical protein GT409_12095 [Tichowtungia aerotolerans]